MSSNYKHQEILLFTNTSFTGRGLHTKMEDGENSVLSKTEQLKQACWNGLVPQILPECFYNCTGKSPAPWQIYEADAFIDLAFGDYERKTEKHCSLNPYVFMQVLQYS